MISVNGYRQDKVLTIAAALEARSEHPLAGAILAKASPGEEASDVEAVPGNGLVGRLASEEVRLGRPGFIGTRSLDDDVVRLQDAGATVVLVERSGVLVGAVGVRDELRREVPGVVLALKDPPLRIAEIVMLTGDNRRTATALAESAGIDEVAAELLPEDKARAIEELQQRHHAAMVGDGINDAPALATASVGIAMGRWAATSPTKRGCRTHGRRSPSPSPGAASRSKICGHHAPEPRPVRLYSSCSYPLGWLGAMGLAAVVAVHELAEVVVIGNGLRAARLSPARALN